MESILFLILFSTLTAIGAPKPPSKGTFKDSYVRYLSTHDLFRLFRQKFPDGAIAYTGDCLRLSDSNRMLLGEPNPATGELSYPEPSLSYVKFIGLCLLDLISLDLNSASLKPQGLHRFFGPHAVNTLLGTPHATVLVSPKTVPWKDIATATKSQIARHLVVTMIGPGILKAEESYVYKLISALEKEPSVVSTFDALSRILFYIGTQDEFLSY